MPIVFLADVLLFGKVIYIKSQHLRSVGQAQHAFVAKQLLVVLQCGGRNEVVVHGVWIVLSIGEHVERKVGIYFQLQQAVLVSLAIGLTFQSSGGLFQHFHLFQELLGLYRLSPWRVVIKIGMVEHRRTFGGPEGEIFLVGIGLCRLHNQISAIVHGKLCAVFQVYGMF